MVHVIGHCIRKNYLELEEKLVAIKYMTINLDVDSPKILVF